jgi:hypothetical protein
MMLYERMSHNDTYVFECGFSLFAFLFALLFIKIARLLEAEKPAQIKGTLLVTL